MGSDRSTPHRRSWIDFSSKLVGYWCPWWKIEIAVAPPATFLFSLGDPFDATIIVVACRLGALETWIGSGEATQQGGANVVGGTGRNRKKGAGRP
jgi:hypothetical protein